MDKQGNTPLNPREFSLRLIYQWLKESNLDHTRHALEQELHRFFDKAYLENLVHLGRFEEAEMYVQDTLKHQNTRSIVFELRKQRYFEACDEKNFAVAHEVFGMLKQFRTPKTVSTFAELGKLLYLDDIREHTHLRTYTTTDRARASLVELLRREIHRLGLPRETFPSVSLQRMVEQYLAHQTQPVAGPPLKRPLSSLARDRSAVPLSPSCADEQANYPVRPIGPLGGIANITVSAFHPEYETVVLVGTATGKVLLFSLEARGKPSLSLDATNTNAALRSAVTTCMWDPKKSSFAVGLANGLVLVFPLDRETQQLLVQDRLMQILNDHRGTIRDLTFCHLENGTTYLLTAGADGFLQLYNTTQPTSITRCQTWEMSVTSLCVDPVRESMVYLALQDGSLLRWDAARDQLPQPMKPPSPLPTGDAAQITAGLIPTHTPASPSQKVSLFTNTLQASGITQWDAATLTVMNQYQPSTVPLGTALPAQCVRTCNLAYRHPDNGCMFVVNGTPQGAQFYAPLSESRHPTCSIVLPSSRHLTGFSLSATGQVMILHTAEGDTVAYATQNMLSILTPDPPAAFYPPLPASSPLASLPAPPINTVPTHIGTADPAKAGQDTGAVKTPLETSPSTLHSLQGNTAGPSDANKDESTAVSPMNIEKPPSLATASPLPQQLLTSTAQKDTALPSPPEPAPTSAHTSPKRPATPPPTHIPIRPPTPPDTHTHADAHARTETEAETSHERRKKMRLDEQGKSGSEPSLTVLEAKPHFAGAALVHIVYTRTPKDFSQVRGRTPTPATSTPDNKAIHAVMLAKNWTLHTYRPNASANYRTPSIPVPHRAGVGSKARHSGFDLSSNDCFVIVSTGDCPSVLSVPNRKVLLNEISHLTDTSAISFYHQDNNLIACGSLHSKVTIWNVNKRTALKEFTLPGGGRVSSLSFNRASKQLVVALAGGYVSFYNDETYDQTTEAHIETTSAAGVYLEFSKDQKRMVIYHKHALEIWSNSGRLLHERFQPKSPTKVKCATFSNDGLCVFAGLSNGEIVVLNVTASNSDAAIAAQSEPDATPLPLPLLARMSIGPAVRIPTLISSPSTGKAPHYPRTMAVHPSQSGSPQPAAPSPKTYLTVGTNAGGLLHLEYQHNA